MSARALRPTAWLVLLGMIWDRTGKVLFFDSGEDEMTPDFELPEMTPDSRSWLAGYLAETCEGSRIEHRPARGVRPCGSARRAEPVRGYPRLGGFDLSRTARIAPAATS
jgi:hypothetical protein